MKLVIFFNLSRIVFLRLLFCGVVKNLKNKKGYLTQSVKLIVFSVAELSYG